jgi:hypothetical protein
MLTPLSPLAYRTCASGVRPDVIALYFISGGGWQFNLHAFTIVAGNHIALRCCRTANRVIGRAADQHAVQGVAEIHCPRGVRAQIAVDDGVRAAADDLDAITAEAVDDERADRAVGSSQRN